MKKYIDSYTKEIENYIENPDERDIKEMKKEHLVQIQFIQHERLVHWLVTMLVGVILFISMGIFFLQPDKIALFALIILLLGLLIPYLMYYYYIENATQYLYTLYNKLNDIEKEMNKKDEKSE